MIRGEFDHGWPYWGRKETMALKPLGHRVLIRPDEQPEQSEGGLVLPQDHDHVSFSGTVVAVGKGSYMAQRIHASVIRRCIRLVEQVTRDYPMHYATAIRDVLNVYATTQYEMHPLKVGDRVAFSAESGAVFTEDGQQYLVMNEDDVVVLVEEKEAVA